jgi:hypothetical protein
MVLRISSRQGGLVLRTDTLGAGRAAEVKRALGYALDWSELKDA